MDFELTTESVIEFVGNLWRSRFEVETMAMGDFTCKVIVVFDINHPGCSRIRRQAVGLGQRLTDSYEYYSSHHQQKSS